MLHGPRPMTSARPISVSTTLAFDRYLPIHRPRPVTDSLYTLLPTCAVIMRVERLKYGALSPLAALRLLPIQLPESSGIIITAITQLQHNLAVAIQITTTSSRTITDI